MKPKFWEVIDANEVQLETFEQTSFSAAMIYAAAVRATGEVCDVRKIVTRKKAR